MTVKFFTSITLYQSKNFIFSDLMNKINNCLTKDQALGNNYLPFQTAFTTEYENLDAVMKNSRKSLLTNEITFLDEQQIQLWRIIKASARDQQKLADQTIANAANFIMSVINNHGDIPRLKITERSGALTNLCQDLTGKYADLVALLGLTNFANQLNTTNAAFLEKYEERLHEWSEYTDGEVVAARAATENALENLCIAVAYGILTQGFAPFKHFVDYTNEAIKVAKIAMGVSIGKPEGGEPSGGEQSGNGGTEQETPTTPPENEPSNPGGGENNGAGGGDSGSAGGEGGSTETPTDPTKILLLFNDGAHGNVIVKRMEVEPGYQLSAADLPEGFVYAFKADDQADIDAASPGDTVWITLAPRG